MFGLGPLELVLILVVVIMLFGTGKLPEAFSALGKGVRELRKEAEADGLSATVTKVETPVEPKTETK